MEGNNKTVIFFGAGITASLGMPTTENQDNYFRNLFFKEQTTEPVDGLYAFVRKLFTEKSFAVQKLYNLIDSAVSDNRGIGNYSRRDVEVFRSEILEELQIYFSDCERKALTEKKDEFLKLQSFFEKSARIQLNRKGEMIKNKTPDLQSEEFIFSDVSYISTNWDVLLLWSMMLAHKKLNNMNCDYYSDRTGIFKLKVFNDFYAYLNSVDVNNIDGSTANWFPYNQTVAYHINDTDHPSDKRIFLFPTFFPHGQTHWLHCPKCGNLTMFIDKSFDVFSENFPMKKDKKYHCAHCKNSELDLKNSAMLLQTNFKVKEPYIEMIQRSMRIALKDAAKIIFIGYSLPDDDIDYRSVFTEANVEKKKTVYVVLHENDAQNSFVRFDKMSAGKQKDKAQRFADVFGAENTFVNFAGSPAALDKVIELLNEEIQL